MEHEFPRRKSDDRYRRRKLLKQKWMGVALLVVSVVLVWLCSVTHEDCSAVFLTAPLGLLLLLSKNIWIV